MIRSAAGRYFRYFDGAGFRRGPLAPAGWAPLESTRRVAGSRPSGDVGTDSLQSSSPKGGQSSSNCSLVAVVCMEMRRLRAVCPGSAVVTGHTAKACRQGGPGPHSARTPATFFVAGWLTCPDSSPPLWCASVLEGALGPGDSGMFSVV